MKPKYYILVLGCQMNKSDAERLATVLEKTGYKKANKEDQADLIAVVACSVRQTAVDRIHGKINRWKKLSQKPVTILTGCVLPDDNKKLEKHFDVVLNINEINDLPKMIANPQQRRVNVCSPLLKAEMDYFHIPPSFTSKFQALVPISKGCDNFCTYCAVPYTRSREKHRPAKEILGEIDGLVKKGYKEITLLGQMVNSYKNPEKDSKIKDFADLLDEVANRTRRRDSRIPPSGAPWIWFTSPYPTLFTDKLINVIADNKNIERYIHLPVQSGSNSVLKRMNRKYTREQYLDVIAKIRKKTPDISIFTDAIVGFSGETKKEFAETLDLFKEVKFDMAYTAQYSQRPNTAAAKSPALCDDIPKTEKKKREKILTGLLRITALEKNKRFLNKKEDVLVESCDEGACFGKTYHGKNIKFDSKKDLTGSFVKLKVIKAEAFRLKGKIL